MRRRQTGRKAESEKQRRDNGDATYDHAAVAGIDPGVLVEAAAAVGGRRVDLLDGAVDDKVEEHVEATEGAGDLAVALERDAHLLVEVLLEVGRRDLGHAGCGGWWQAAGAGGATAGTRRSMGRARGGSLPACPPACLPACMHAAIPPGAYVSGAGRGGWLGWLGWLPGARRPALVARAGQLG